MRHPAVLLTALLLILGVAGVTVYGVTFRAKGLSKLEQTLVRLDSEGYGRTLGDYYAAAPPVDAGRQARAWAWVSRKGTSWMGDVDRWYLDGQAQPPPKVVEQQEAFRGEALELRRLLAEGPVCLSALGWPPEDLETWRPLGERMPKIPNLLRIRQAYRFFGLEALSTKDPTTSLDVLERLHESVAHPGTLIDAMIAIACDAMRDRTHLLLASRGALPEAALDGWCREPARGAGLAAQAWRGERLGFLGPVAEGLLRGESFTSSIGEVEGAAASLDDLRLAIRGFFAAPAELAGLLEAEAAMEGYLRGKVDAVRAGALWERAAAPGGTTEIMRPNVDAIVWTAISTETGHNAARAAVLLIERGRRVGRVPESEAEALSWLGDEAGLLTGRGLALPLRYERVAEDRLRIALDPAQPLPEPIVDTYRHMLAESPLRKPAAPGRLVIHHPGVEIRLPSTR